MADRLLLESGAPDGFLLEDGSGVLLMERTGYPNVVTQDAPIAYWRLGEPSGTFANDEIGTADGTYGNTPTLGVTGLISGDADTAVTFARASDEGVDIPSNMPAGGAAASVEAWINLASIPVGGEQTILYWSTSGGNGHALSVLESGGTLLEWYYWDGAAQTKLCTVALVVGTTYHVVITHDYVTKVIRAFVNDVEFAIVDATTTALAPAAGTHTSIGKYWGSGAISFDGTIDEVAVYSYVVTPTQVSEHYAAGAGSGPPPDDIFPFMGGGYYP